MILELPMTNVPLSPFVPKTDHVTGDSNFLNDVDYYRFIVLGMAATTSNRSLV